MSLTQCMRLLAVACSAAGLTYGAAANELQREAPAISSGTTTVIRVVAMGFRHRDGDVRMSLHAGPEGFPDQPEHSLQWQKCQVLGDSAVVDFAPVLPGHYAVAVFDDEDGDGAMRRDWMGRPKEGWGVSRDAKGHFGPPHFDDARFEATGDTCTVRLHLRY